jgi:3-hydroxybutyryl-CoA dehydratase
MNIHIGDKHIAKKVITDEMIVGFAESTGDKNPVHLDEQYAATTFFKKRIAHGMLAGGLISSVMGNEFPGNGTIYISQSLSFLAPVFINDEITIEVEVISFTEKNRIEMRTDCINQDGVAVVRGTAFVLPPKHHVLIR